MVDEMFFPDADNVIPITDEEYLDDDIVSRLCVWLKVVYGADTLEANLDYIAKALGNKGSTSREIIRSYFLKDFFKDHCLSLIHISVRSISTSALVGGMRSPSIRQWMTVPIR